MQNTTPPDTQKGESWKPHPDHPDLLVSSKGRFYDQDSERFVGVVEGARLRLFRDSDVINLTPGRAVLITFGEEPPGGVHFAVRKDQDGPFSLDNLEWSQRTIGRRKLTDQEVIRIYNEARGTPKTNREIAERYGVHPSTVSSLKNGRTWGHLTGHPHPDEQDE